MNLGARIGAWSSGGGIPYIRKLNHIIRANSNCGLNTLFCPSADYADFKIHINVEFLNTGVVTCFQSIQSSPECKFQLLQYNGQWSRFSNVYGPITGFETGKEYDVTMDFNGLEWTVDGVTSLFSWNNTGIPRTSTVPLTVGIVSDAGQTLNVSNFKMSLFELLNGTTKLMSLVPVLYDDGGTEVAAMYDEANEHSGPLGNGIFKSVGTANFDYD